MDNNYQQETGMIFPRLHDHQYEAGNDQLGFTDFTDEMNFDDQFVDLICGGQNYNHTDEVPVFSLSNHQEEGIYDHHNLNFGSCVCDAADGGHFYPAAVPPVEVFYFDVAMGQFTDVKDSDVSVQKDRVCEEVPQIMNREKSSGTAATTTSMMYVPAKKKGGKIDRSKTLISERTRRGKMKEKLYALRSLVPNITKMDKASIVGDAVLYVQDLQIQANKLKADIAGLQSSLARLDKHHPPTSQNAKNMNTTTAFYPLPKNIFKMDVFQVEERGFHVRIVSNKGRGVAVSLYKAIESFTRLTIVQSSNLAASADNYVLTFSMQIMGEAMDVSLPNVKLWIASNFLNQGFDFETSQFASQSHSGTYCSFNWQAAGQIITS